MMKTLLIKLAAPLQSYGNQASFDRRTTTHYPTKSAIIGMIAAARGWRRDDSRIIGLNRLQMAVRIDQPGKPLTDFQTVEWKAGKRKITYRYYLQDAVFMVAVTGDDTELDEINWALHHPKFALFLGRRSNPPAGNLETVIMQDVAPIKTLEEYPWQAAKWFRKRYQREKHYLAEVIADAELLPEQANSVVRDAVGSFSQRHRWHEYRAVVTTRVPLGNDLHAPDAEEHDVWSTVEGDED